MPRRSVLSLGACAAALLCGTTAAHADVTAAEVWDSWVSSVNAARPDMMTHGAPEMSGDTLTVPEVGLSFEDEGTRFVSDVGDITLTENGDGTVTIEMADSYPFSLTTPEGPTLTAEITQENMVIVASGTPGAISYAVTADQYAIDATDMTDPDGQPMEGDFRVALNDVTGTYDVTEGEIRALGYAVSAATVDLLIDATDAAGDSALVSGKMEGLSVDADLAIPASFDSTAPETVFVDGFTGAIRYGLTGGTYLFEISDAESGANGTASTGAIDVSAAIALDRVDYRTSVSNVALDMTAPDLPIPVAVQIASYGLNASIPLSATEAPADFALGFNITDLAVNDELWLMGDPGGALPHDPVTLRLDLTGTMRVLSDLLDPAQSATLEEGAPPAELNSISLNDLAINAAGASVTGQGAFTFDNSDMTTVPGMPRPEGSVTFDISGANALIDALVGMGVLPEDQAMMGRMMMGMFARSTGDDQLTSTIEVNAEGHVLANGQRIQ